MTTSRKFHLPVSHRPVMPVPEGGARCSTCRFLRRDARTLVYTCASRYYQEFMGTSVLPYPPETMCSDWYEPG